MRALVIGGSKFLGLGIVDELLHNDFAVWVLNRGSSIIKNTTQITADRNDATQLEQLKNLNFDLVVDTCCYTLLQAQIVQAALKNNYQHFVHISSAAVYSSDITPHKETDTRLGGAVWGDYGREKAEIDSYLATLNNVAKKITILIPPYLYGINNYLGREHLLWAMILNNKAIHIPNSGSALLHFITPNEIGQIIINLHKANNAHSGQTQVFNVGSSNACITIRQYVELLFTIANKPHKIIELNYATHGLTGRDFFPFRDIALVLDTSLLARHITLANKSLGAELNNIFAQLDKQILKQCWHSNPIYSFTGVSS